METSISQGGDRAGGRGEAGGVSRGGQSRGKEGQRREEGYVEHVGYVGGRKARWSSGRAGGHRSRREGTGQGGGMKQGGTEQGGDRNQEGVVEQGGGVDQGRRGVGTCVRSREHAGGGGHRSHGEGTGKLGGCMEQGGTEQGAARGGQRRGGDGAGYRGQSRGKSRQGAVEEQENIVLAGRGQSRGEG